MAMLLTTPPAIEPVGLVEAKQHLRVDLADEDDLILHLLSAARLLVEQTTGLALIQQGWTVLHDDWPQGPVVELPLSPVSAVGTVQVFGEDDVASPVDPADYFLDAASRPARIVRRGSRVWPQPGREANGIAIDLTCGFGNQPDDVPQPLRQSILQLAGHWFEHRSSVHAGPSPHPLPMGVSGLLAPYRSTRL